MSGDWMKIEVALPEKPEVWQIAGILRTDADAVVGKLFKVWRWFDTHTVDGNALGVTYSLIDSIVSVTGFGEAMALVGWLEQDGSILRLPHFDRHNGKTAKNRALTAKRVAKSKEKGNAKGNDDSVTSALPREEKRREEERASLPPDGCPHSEIVDLYHEVLPANPRIKSWTGKRQSNLRTRWREDSKRQSLDYWRRFFAHVAASPFLTGQRADRQGRPFLPGLDWLVMPENFAKVIEGRYHDNGGDA